MNIVINENSGKVINEMFNKWNNISSQKEWDNWASFVNNNSKFGTYGTIGLLEIIEKFNPSFPSQWMKDSFLKELKSVLKSY